MTYDSKYIDTELELRMRVKTRAFGRRTVSICLSTHFWFNLMPFSERSGSELSYTCFERFEIRTRSLSKSLLKICLSYASIFSRDELHRILDNYLTQYKRETAAMLLKAAVEVILTTSYEVSQRFCYAKFLDKRSTK